MSDITKEQAGDIKGYVGWDENYNALLTGAFSAEQIKLIADDTHNIQKTLGVKNDLQSALSSKHTGVFTGYDLNGNACLNGSFSPENLYGISTILSSSLSFGLVKVSKDTGLENDITTDKSGSLLSTTREEQLEHALEEALKVIQDYIDYRHDGDPWTEDARVMGEMEIDDYAKDGRLANARILLNQVNNQFEQTDESDQSDQSQSFFRK